MTELSEFSLGTPLSDAQRRLARAPLLRDGKAVGFHLEGTVLLHQFHTTHGYLFITDYDCPFEEETSVTLCSHDFRLLSRRGFGGFYSSHVLERIEHLDDERLLLDFGPKHRWLLSIRPWGIPYLHPRLKLSRMKRKSDADASARAD